MKLGLNVGYWQSGTGRDVGAQVAQVQEAERAGYAVVWVAEAYGSDAATMLTWFAAHTSRIDIGSAIFQIPARSPAMTAMTAATLDALSEGRFRLGLGVSGPQVSEGWHGVRFAQPLGRTREYVAIVRAALARERVSFTGEHFTLPLPDGPGKALRLSIRPERERIPLYLAAIGPKNLELTGAIADGCIPMFYIPEHSSALREHLTAGRISAGFTDDPLAGFDLAPSVPVSIDDDLDVAYDRVRAYTALYVGGMGSAKQNFYNQLAVRAGFGAVAEQVQQLYLERRPREAAAALPKEFLDLTALIGPPARIAERLHSYADTGVTTLSINVHADDQAGALSTIRTMGELLRDEGLAERE